MSRQKRPSYTGSLHDRIVQAMVEQRFQHALDLARQQLKQQPTPVNRQLLHDTALGRSRQLRAQGATRDAAAVLKAQLETPGLTEAMKAQLAEELALCGEAQTALTLVGADNQQMRERILAALADAAVRQQKAGRQLLPESLRPDFDRVLLAFDQLEAGRDDAVREALQAISLRSPFLEWKLLLRGLQAYYQSDDARALENWQRLRPERTPARLAAPLRFQIDRAFQTAQPPATQALLLRHMSRLQGNSATRILQDMREAIAKTRNLAAVFRQAEQALNALRRDAPHLVPRLASVCYWTILSQGHPEDVPRYQRVFGSPPDDPHFHRLEAMAWERTGDMAEAHKHWLALQQEIASRPEAWPGEQGARARALIWQRLGRNASVIPDQEQLNLLPPFLRNHPNRPRELKPGAEECFRQCITLMPNEVDGYRDLFQHLVEKKKTPKAITVGKDMLKRFPNDVPMLTRLGEAQMGEQKYDQAIETLQRALKNNPLDRTLRGRLGMAYLFNARTQTEAGEFDEARQSYQLSLEMSTASASSVYCKWAACEIKAGDAERGEELIQQALAGLDSQLAVSYSMVIEAIRLKLPAAVKKRFDAAFKSDLAAPPDPVAALHLAEVTMVHMKANVEYTGKKSHQKKVLDYLKQALKATFTEEQLEGICQAMVGLDAYRLTAQYLDKGRRAFDANPLFPLLQAENEMGRGPGAFRPWTVSQQLKLADERARLLPPGPKRDGLLDRIHEHQKMLDALNPFGRMFGRMIDPFGDDGFDEGEEDYW